MTRDTLPVLQWRKIKSRSVSNLKVLSVRGREVGFIEKPEDRDGDRNAWRCFSGIGVGARFIGHEWTKSAAIRRVENVFRVVKI